MKAKIAVLAAMWHTRIVESAERAFVEDMHRRGGSPAQIDIIKVPGALEIPLAGKMALENGYDVAVGIAFVVDGQIYRHEFVAQAVVQGLVDVALATGKPFLSVVLTPQSYSEHSGVYEEMYVQHMVEKGREAAGACERMLQVRPEIRARQQAA